MSFAFLLLLLLANNALAYIFPCYYVYEPATLKPESIPVDMCTHIIILGCVTQLANDSVARYVTKPYNCSHVLRKMALLKQENPALKLVMSMATDADVMHTIVKKNETMEAYASSAVQLVLDFDFDGIDLDWEYPCGTDRFKFTRLLQNFRAKIDASPRQLSLSAAIGAGLNTLNLCYDLSGKKKQRR